MMAKGKVYALSIGHTRSQITPEAQAVLQRVDVVAGHPGFIEIARPFLNEAAEVIDDRVTMRMADTPEAAKQSRVAAVVAQALAGKSVAILSGGDTGIWGYAGFFLEAQQFHDGAFDVEVIPGVAGMVAAAARVGAPLMNGFALIALGDEDTPFAVIERRLRGAALGGFAIVLYKLILESAGNPAFYPPERYPELHPPLERTRERLERAYAILAEQIAAATPMAIITDVYDQSSNYSSRSPLLGTETGQEEIILTTFDQFLRYSDRYRFLTTVIIGEEMTRLWRDKMYTAQWNRRWAYDDQMEQRVAPLEYLVKAKEFFQKRA
ncbi:MAG: SAM-dependent methyltransferase [Anaerolineae bacterium]